MADGDFYDNDFMDDDDDDLNYSNCAEEQDIECVVDQEDYDKNYSILSLSAVLEQMNNIAAEVSKVIVVSPATMRLLLRKFHWNSEKLMEKFMETGEIDIFLADTVYIDRTLSLDFAFEGECEICYCHGDLRCLVCGHAACTDCWNSFISTKVRDDGSVEITCFSNDCGIVMNDEQVLSLITDAEIVHSYNRLLGNVFVDSNRSLRWCPGADCDMVVQLNSSKALSVYCECGTDICPKCNECAHLPLSCERFKSWKDGKAKDSDSLKWINENSRPCPACKAPIEKTGGCNFMKCTNPACNIPFCWTCMNKLDQDHQAHSCHLFNGTFETPEMEDIKRFNHYLQRFKMHRNSEDIEKQLRQRIEKFLGKQEKEGCYKSHAAVVSRAVEELLECRRVLAYSYCFIYYLKSDESRGQQLMLEDNVEDLEMATEKMSSLFEKDADIWSSTSCVLSDVVAMIRDKTKYMENRRNKLLDHCAECVDEGLC